MPRLQTASPIRLQGVLMGIALNAFLSAPSQHARLVLIDNAQGDPAIAGARQPGLFVRLLSCVPLLKNFPAPRRYRMENARATGLFLHALSCEYGAQATSGMLRRVRISLDGALTPRVISRARNDLERNRQGQPPGGVRDQASSGARATSSTLPHTPRPRPAKAPAAQNGTELPSVALPGLPNLGNTCYANAALKFVLSAYGPRAVQRAPTHRSCRPARPPRIGPSRTSWALWQPAPMRWSRICAGCFPHCRTLPNSRCSATRRPIGNTTRRTSRKG